jgi:hypothetical protein
MALPDSKQRWQDGVPFVFARTQPSMREIASIRLTVLGQCTTRRGAKRHLLGRTRFWFRDCQTGTSARASGSKPLKAHQPPRGPVGALSLLLNDQGPHHALRQQLSPIRLERAPPEPVRVGRMEIDAAHIRPAI